MTLPVPQAITVPPHAHRWGTCYKTKFGDYRQACTVSGCTASQQC